MEQKPLCVLTGRVVHGKGKGHRVGMPTANLAAAPGTLLPKEGVYITTAAIDDREVIGVTNVGHRPSVDHESHITIETLFLDFSGDLYGRELELRFYRYLRPTRVFASLGEVKTQVEQDAAAAKEYMNEWREKL